MKTTKDKILNKVPAFTIDPLLDQYKDKNLFPEKLAKANEVLKTIKLPDINKYRK